MVYETQKQIELFKEFIEDNYKDELHRVVNEGKQSLVIDFSELAKFDFELAEQLLDQPEELLKACEIAIDQIEIATGKKIKPRFFNLPTSQEISIRNLRSVHLGKFLSIVGIVRQASDVRPQVTSARFECPACGNIISVLQLENVFREPARCTCGRKGRFRLLSKELVDAQRLVIEEVPEMLEGGEQPKRISVFLKGDLVEPKMEKRTTPGNKVGVYGIVKEVPIMLKGGVHSTRYDLAVEANYIEPLEESFEEIEITPEDEAKIQELAKDPKIYEKLVKTIAPSIYGHEDIKLALAFQLFGGVKKQRPDGTRTRGDIHILLVGDPGSGKSMLLKFIANVAPKGRYVSGKGASTAGLCVAPDSLVYTNPGFVKIQEMVDRNLSKISFKYATDVEYAPNITCKRVYTLSSDRLRLVPVERFWKLKAPKFMFKIATASGREIEITPETKLLTFSGWKKAKELSIGEFVACSRIIASGIQDRLLTISLIKSDPKIYGIEDVVREILKKLTKKYKTKRKLAKELCVSEDKLYYCWINKKAHGKIKLSQLKCLAKLARISLADVLKSAKLTLALRNGKYFQIPTFVNKDLLYFAGVIAGDGDLKISGRSGYVRLSTKSKSFALRIKKLLKKLFGVDCRLERTKGLYVVRIGSVVICEILNSLGIPCSPKCNKLDMGKSLLSLENGLLKHYLVGLFDTDGCVVRRKFGGYVELTTTSKLLAKKLLFALNRFGIYAWLRKRKPSPTKLVASKLEKYVVVIRGKENLLKFYQEIGFSAKEKLNALKEVLKSIKVGGTNVDVIPKAKEILGEIKGTLGLKFREIFGYKRSLYFENNTISTSKFWKIIEIILTKYPAKREKLFKILEKYNLHKDIFWDKIKRIELISPNYEFVYDLTVENTHNFLVNGFVVHNTASVLRDEFLKGWALEAGAIVLANQGAAALDELDKLSQEDTAALHEAMELQTITISKANIQATLRAETTILAAANPKFGRFDPYQPIAAQIAMPPTLINRFDLIFPVRDLPSKDKDDAIATHILELQRKPQDIKHEIPLDLLKKYISYARQKIHPILTEAALKEIKDFYVNLRNMEISSDTGIKPIPITARQLEALVRLAEASAKVRLSQTVTKADAKRAINILKHCLIAVGFDYETKTFDIDRISTGIPASQRSKIVIVREIIDDFTNSGIKTIPIDEIVAEAAEKGIREDQVEEIIDKLKKEGIIFEPKRGFIQKI